VAVCPLLRRCRLHRLLRALLVRPLMRRGFFGRAEPVEPPAESGAPLRDDDDEEGLDTPKNRRRLPKQARARAAHAAAQPRHPTASSVVPRASSRRMPPPLPCSAMQNTPKAGL
jgi:hypothetical protein